MKEACRRFTVGSRKHNAPMYNFAKVEAVAVDDEFYRDYINTNTAVPYVVNVAFNHIELPVIPGRKKNAALDLWRRVCVLKYSICLSVSIY